MEVYNKYAAQANTIKIEDITSDKQNQTILLQLKDNDSTFNRLSIMDCEVGNTRCDHFYIPEDQFGEDIGWLGYFIGNSTNIKTLNLCTTFTSNSHSKSFFKGLTCNNNIQNLLLTTVDLADGKVFRMLGLFFKRRNSSLTRIEIENCRFGNEDVRHLSLAIGSCNKSLTNIRLQNLQNNMEVVQLVDIITAMSMHPQLEELNLSEMNIGRYECSVLSTLISHTTTKLQTLSLYENNIDDTGVEMLVNALTTVNTLQHLELGTNQLITMNGWKAVATLLEGPDSKLKWLHIYCNDIGDYGAQMFASALSSNSSLEKLDLDYCQITREGWIPFSKLLCDTSSVNKTYLSNHTLHYVGDEYDDNDLSNIPLYLDLNEHENKQKVAMNKILHAHSHFDLCPFFEWEFKVLPIMIRWFTKAAAGTNAYHERNSCKMKLSAVYDFVKEFPMLYIEPVTRKEIAGYTAMEEALQGAEHQGQLEEIRQRKARAMRRL